MYDDNFLCKLLECLENEEVIEKISLFILDKNANSSLNQEDKLFKRKLEDIENEYNHLKSKYEKTVKSLENSEQMIRTVEESLKFLKNENEDIKNEKQNVLNELEQIKSCQYMFDIYKSLENSTKEDLKGVFKQETFENFISCGCQKSNIDTIWEFTKNLIINNKFNELEKLNDILDYFINKYNDISSKPTLAIQDVKIGMEFDTSLHIKTQDSKPSGKISEIYLIGYFNTINQKIINKTIVRVD